MISIVTGGAIGDEGKGKVVAFLAKNYDIIVRAGGGPNAGHTVDGSRYVCQVTSGFVNEKALLLIGRGTAINPKTLLNEIEKYNLHDRVKVDHGCTIIEQEDIENEKELVERIGSVGTGTGTARVKRVLRTAKIARDVPELNPYIIDVQGYVLNNLDKNILIEGVQGFCLDLMDAIYYPHVTSQCTIASQFCSDVGIGPRDIDNVYCCVKAFTTRVGTGKLLNEWNEEDRLKINERGTISGRLRRVGDFDIKTTKRALKANSANFLVINSVDKLYPEMAGVKSNKDIPNHIYNHYYDLVINKLQFKGTVYLGTGQDYNDMVRLIIGK